MLPQPLCVVRHPRVGQSTRLCHPALLLLLLLLLLLRCRRCRRLLSHHVHVCIRVCHLSRAGLRVCVSGRREGSVAARVGSCAGVCLS